MRNAGFFEMDKKLGVLKKEQVSKKKVKTVVM